MGEAVREGELHLKEVITPKPPAPKAGVLLAPKAGVLCAPKAWHVAEMVKVHTSNAYGQSYHVMSWCKEAYWLRSTKHARARSCSKSRRCLHHDQNFVTAIQQCHLRPCLRSIIVATMWQTDLLLSERSRRLPKGGCCPPERRLCGLRLPKSKATSTCRNDH